eukprot:55494-Pelagomonas_calceolata.AAC.1
MNQNNSKLYPFLHELLLLHEQVAKTLVWASQAFKQMGKGRSKLVEKDEDGVARQMCMGARKTPADAKRHLEAHCKKLKE